MTDIFEQFVLAFPSVSPVSSHSSKKTKTTRSAIVERRKNRRKHGKKTPSTNTVNIPKYIIEQWIQTMKGGPRVPPPGTIPYLYCSKDDYSPWLYNMITSVHRKRTEWHLLIVDMWKGSKLVEPDVPTTLKHPNPFFYNQAISSHLDKLMCLNISLRMCVLRYVQRRLLAKMDLRVVGEDDLHTTTRIPDANKVSVYDFKTRAKYVFHTNTILKMILASLRYCTYGIASPKMPKNPYTNLEWTHPQMMSITQQIVCNMAALHRIPPPLFLNYYNCNYTIKSFAKFCEKELGIYAAIELFKLKDDPTTQDIYGETIDDFLEELDIIMSARVRQMVVERKLPDRIQEKWDTIIIALWIYTNICILYGNYKTYDELLDSFKQVYNETRSYVYEITRTSRRQRTAPTNGSLLRTYAFGVLIDAAIYTDNVLEFSEEPSLTVNL